MHAIAERVYLCGPRHATIRRLPEGVPPLTLEGSGPGAAPAAFGPFRVLHQLGAGTLGPVFRAHDPVEGRLVAIKAFKLDLTPERAVELAGALDDLVTRALNHPTIAAPIATGLESTTTWLAQAYVPAESLDAALRQFGPAPISHVVTTVTHLAGALDFAAAAGVVHGSLHPRDVLVAPGEAYLIDTGVVPALERCGIRTPLRRPYTAPERLDGAPASRAADVFALAAITVELLTGQPIAGAGEGALPPLPEMPGADAGALEAVLTSALAVDPDARPATALAFASAFKAALGAAAFRSTPAVAPRRPARPAPMVPLDEPAQQEETLLAAPAPSEDAREEPPSEPAPLSAHLTSEEREAYRAPAAEPYRFSDLESDDFDLDLPAREESAAVPSRTAAPPPAPVYQAPRRSMSSAIVLVVLAATLTGFGIGWVWSTWGGSASSDAPAQQAAADARAPAEPQPTGADADIEAESPGPIAEASSGVEPERRADEASAAPATAATPTPVRGRLLVRSSPAGAAVEVGGRTRGRTPLTLRDLPLGSHTIVVRRPGYEPQRRTVRLTRDRSSRSLQVSLREAAPRDQGRPQRFSGSMVVESRPRDARVVLNGKAVGRTPLVLPDVRAGSHVVRLEMDGYRTWTASVRVVAGQRNRVTASLEEMQ